ncbi:MAG: hypothetical protein HY593_02120 [Candidatus Omnitrophica bacterium]|nr:hypothetical protein [Candidatus Omnitrophota bacterium]
MFKRSGAAAAAAFLLFAVSGCATGGRNYQGDIDALNSRVSLLQGQLSAKDEEIARLQSQIREQQTAVAEAEAEKRLLSERLDAALTQSRERKEERLSKAAESDLK